MRRRHDKMRRPSLEKLANAVDRMTRLVSHKKRASVGKEARISEAQGLKRSCRSVVRHESATLLCSGSNSFASVKQALFQIKEDGTTLKLRIHDLILCDDDDKLFAVEDYLIQSTTEMMVVPEGESLHQPKITDWKSIEFVDCVSSREQYLDYMVKRKRFVKTLSRYYRMWNRTSLGLPLSFRVKQELHASMDIFSIIQVFQEIVHDPTVQEVEFPDFLKDPLFADSSNAAAAFASMVDKSTLRWSGPTVTLCISYRDDGVEPSHPRPEQEDQQMLQWQPPCRRLMRKDQFVRGSARYNSATVALLKECTINLEKLTLMHSFRGGGCRTGSSLSILSSTNSRRASVYGGIQL